MVIDINQDLMKAALENAKNDPNVQTSDAEGVDILKDMENTRNVDVSQSIIYEGDQFTIPAVKDIKPYLIKETYPNLPKRRNPTTGQMEPVRGNAIMVTVRNPQGAERIARFHLSAFTKTITCYRKDPENDTFVATGNVVRVDNDLTRKLRACGNQMQVLEAVAGHTFRAKKEHEGNQGIMENRMCTGIRRSTVMEFEQIDNE